MYDGYYNCDVLMATTTMYVLVATTTMYDGYYNCDVLMATTTM